MGKRALLGDLVGLKRAVKGRGEGVICWGRGVCRASIAHGFGLDSPEATLKHEKQWGKPGCDSL